MANNQYVNKLVVNGVTKLDLSGDTITADKLASGYTAHDASGAPITGTGSVGKIIISDTQDANGGTIRTISTADEIYLGTKTIDQNGTYSASSDNLDGYSSVTVNVPSGGATLQTKSVTPSESSQTVTPDSGYDGLSSVSVGAIGSSYVGTGVSRKAAATITPSTTDQTIAADTYLTGAQTISGDADLVAGNIKKDVQIFGVTGTYEGSGVQTDTKTATVEDYQTSMEFTSMKGEPKMFTLRLNAQVSSSGSTTYYYIVDITSFGSTTHGNCFRIGNTRRVDNITSGYSWTYSGTTLTISSSASSRSASPGAFYNGSYELLYVY